MMQPIDPNTALIPVDAGDFADENEQPAAAGGLESIIEFARARLVATVEDARDSLVSQVRGLKQFADLFGSNLPEVAQPVAQIISQAGNSIDHVADALAKKSVEELVDDGRALVRAQPGAAVAVAIAVGFLAGRMLKAARD